MTYKSNSELVYSDYYVRLGGDIHHPMNRVNASNPASAVQQYLRENPAYGESGAWVWKVNATDDGREILGDAGLASFHEFSIPHVSNCDGAVLPVAERQTDDT